MTYCWTITVDHVRDERAAEGTNANAVGMVGPSDANLSRAEILEHPEREFFHILDDDGNLYYEGYMVHDRDSTGFEPLDDFGSPNAGATEIRYCNPDGQMATL